MLSPSGDGDGRFARSYALDGLTIDLSYLIVVYSECEVLPLGSITSTAPPSPVRVNAISCPTVIEIVSLESRRAPLGESEP